jgi:hypothetical protein
VHVILKSPATQQMLEQSIPALATVTDKDVQLSIWAGSGIHMTADVVERLGTALGHRLAHLKLSGCTIMCSFCSFWPAVWRHLPGLQGLSISRHVSGAVSSADIAAFCSHSTRPLSLRLYSSLYSQVAPTEQLEQQCRTWGVPQVTVTQL